MAQTAALGQTAHDDLGEGTVSQVHHVTLTGLTPETTYYFRVHSEQTQSTTTAGRCTRSPPRRPACRRSPTWPMGRSRRRRPAGGGRAGAGVAGGQGRQVVRAAVDAGRRLRLLVDEPAGGPVQGPGCQAAGHRPPGQRGVADPAGVRRQAGAERSSCRRKGRSKDLPASGNALGGASRRIDAESVSVSARAAGGHRAGVSRCLPAASCIVALPHISSRRHKLAPA